MQSGRTVAAPCCRCSCCGSPGGWRADRLPAGEGLDDDHRGAAVRADERGLATGYRRRRRRRRCGGDDVQQLACLGEMLAAAGVGEQPVVADAVEAAGQDVQQEAAHELVGLERHGLVPRAALGPVVLPTEGDAALVHGEQAAVGDGHPVGVARQIGEHRGRPGEGALGIDDPFTLRAAARARRRTPARRPVPRTRRRTAAGRRDARHRVLRGSGGGTVATAPAPAGRSPACRRPTARRRARARRPGRCRAHADGASAPTPRCAGPGSRRSARRDAWGRRRWCAGSPRRPRTAGRRSRVLL